MTLCQTSYDQINNVMGVASCRCLYVPCGGTEYLDESLRSAQRDPPDVVGSVLQGYKQLRRGWFV